MDSGAYISKSEASRPVTRYNEAPHITYILPQLTKPFDLLENQTKQAIWNEMLVFNELYLYLLKPHTLVLFEILDFKTSVKSGKYDPWHRVAWAFLRLVSGTGRANTEIEARLQLFKYPKNQQNVFECWKMPRIKYPSTLYILFIQVSQGMFS
jgi:jouberin